MTFSNKNYLNDLFVWFLRTEKRSQKGNEFADTSRMVSALPYWVPELIDWIGKETDPVTLASAAYLINCHTWPEFLPGKPENYHDMNNRELLYFTVELMRMLEGKREAICPYRIRYG